MDSIGQAISQDDLYVCSDGSYLKTSSHGSHAWVFSTSTGTVLWYGAGPACGHSALMAAYRAELSGLISFLYLLNNTCYEQEIQPGFSRSFMQTLQKPQPIQASPS